MEHRTIGGKKYDVLGYDPVFHNPILTLCTCESEYKSKSKWYSRRQKDKKMLE